MPLLSYKNVCAQMLTAIVLFSVAMPACAAVVTPSIISITSAPGKTFTVQYGVDPAGQKIYTTNIVVHFPPALVQLQSFVFTPGAVAVPQPGYDEVNNSKGSFTKTAGYPKGIAVPTIFGTATFKVIGEGSGTITLDTASLVLNAQNTNVLTNLRAGSVALTAGATLTPSVVASTGTPPVLFDVKTGSIAPAPASSWWIVVVLCIFFIVLLLVLRWLWWLLVRHRSRDLYEKK